MFGAVSWNRHHNTIHLIITADTWFSIVRPSVAQFFFAGSKIRTVKWRVLALFNNSTSVVLGTTPGKAVFNIQNKQKIQSSHPDCHWLYILCMVLRQQTKGLSQGVKKMRKT